MSKDPISFSALFILVLFAYKKFDIDKSRAVRNIKKLKYFFLFILILNCCFYSDVEPWFSYSIFTPTAKGLWQGVKVVVRTILILLYSETVLDQGSPVALAEGFVHILYPLKFLLLPVGTLSMIFSLSFSFINILNEEVERIKKAQKLRGLTFEHKGLKNRIEAVSALLLPLFLSAFHRADELSLALDSRGYDPKKKVKFERFLFKQDIKFIALNLVILILVLIGGKYVQY